MISEKMAVFPGDVPFRRQKSLSFQGGHHIELSSIQTTLHLGAHADSSSHYHRSGQGIEGRRLDAYFGDCQVIEVRKPGSTRILPTDIEGVTIRAPRVLFKTGSVPDPTQWSSDFNSLSPELIQKLAHQGVVLVGIDTPSVDPENSKLLESHQALFEHQVAVLEGLSLERVPAGVYKLIAFPLPIQGGDASPVRAILIDDATAWRDSGLQEI